MRLDGDAYMLTHQAAKVLDVTPDAVRKASKRGALSFVRIGHTRVFLRAEIEALAEKRKAAKNR